MKSCREMRADAWGIIVHNGWLGRMLVVCVVLNLVAQMVSSALSGAFGKFEVQTWGDFLIAKLNAIRAGLDYTAPSISLAWQMTGATAFQTFILYIFGAIVAFGIASVSLKATGNRRERWFVDSFGGFGRPLELGWLMLMMNLRVILWSLLFLLPGLVAVYRYRQAWFLKSEHPDWSAAKCLAESGRMMRGFKWKAFVFDLSFLGWFAVTGILVGSGLGVSGIKSAAGTVAAAFVGIAAASLVFFVMCYVLAGRAVFFRELKGENGGQAVSDS